MEREPCEMRISAVADLRNLTSQVRNREVSPSRAAETLENALKTWADIYPDADVPLAEGRRLAACIRWEDDFLADGIAGDVARSIASLANQLVDIPLAS